MDSKKINLFGVIASIIALVSVFFPYVQATAFGTTAQVSLMDDGNGMIILIISIIAALLAFVNQNGLLIAGGIADLAFFIVNNSGDRYFSSQMAQKGMGYFLLLIGSILMIIAGIYKFYTDENNKKVNAEKEN